MKRSGYVVAELVTRRKKKKKRGRVGKERKNENGLTIRRSKVDFGS